ncbi:hypothetical protein VN97_g3057 [Penicillium thymicola]|uniref:Uncharacterized protein n=1 Tax=Penicillium thymicola TaxID=293382 RepID=A0AAI9TNA2_PENTH|nr:hypothetical protein VN97_g3057 [Penicillium thymicola]
MTSTLQGNLPVETEINKPRTKPFAAHGPSYHYSLSLLIFIKDVYKTYLKLFSHVCSPMDIYIPESRGNSSMFMEQTSTQ